MPAISQQKKDKIAEQILHYLFTISPEAIFTVKISKEIARDEEFTKSILQSLERKKIVISINKNRDGKTFLKRQRWRLSDQAYNIYQKHQQSNNNNLTQNYNNIYNPEDKE